jgi:hypothetical protein
VNVRFYRLGRAARRAVTGLEGNLDMDHEQRLASPTDADMLAFIPDVDAAATSAAGDTPASRPLGRLLSQPTSAKLLLAGAVVLVVAAIVPFLFSKKEASKPVAEGAPGWQPGPASQKADGGPKWNGGSTLPQTPEALPGTGKETASSSVPTTADLRGAVKPPASSPPPTPLWGDRTAPAAPSTDEQLRMIAPPRTPPAASPDYPQTPDPRDTRYETRRPAPAYERAYQPPQSPVGLCQPMAVGDPNVDVAPDYRPADRRDYTPDYRREATPDYRREMPSDYRQDTAADYRREEPATAGYRQDDVPDYRRQPAPDYRQESPAGYRPGATPSLADRRMTPPPAGGQTPGVGQPGVARIEGIIDTSPARTSNDFARPGVY